MAGELAWVQGGAVHISVRAWGTFQMSGVWLYAWDAWELGAEILDTAGGAQF